jgi:endonuclease/exonuclease/phosphatase family metal-dependent hydrolase
VSLAAALALSSACAGGYQLKAPPTPFSSVTAGISWLTPAEATDARILSRWRAAVGAPVISQPVAARVRPVDTLTVVSWNIALGSGDLPTVFRSLQHEHPERGIVLLIQEAFRGGDEVPRSPRDAAFARRIDCSPEREIEDVARSLGLSLYYVPSMRNGAPGVSNEDRGNAILATLPLENLAAIELPFEKQRRVAIAATVSGTSSSGRSWSLRVASAHLDNSSGWNRALIGSEYARTRQARGLRDALDGAAPLLLAGDFNTWFGFNDAAYRETVRAFPGTRVSDTRRTFRGLMRLDHVFYRLPDGWRADFKRAESAFGSDHYPLITSVHFDAEHPRAATSPSSND